MRDRTLATWEETEESKERYATCLTCDAFTHETQVCKECGCFMPPKVTVSEATCPLSKW